MDSFALSDTIQAVRELMHKFADGEIRPVAPQHDEQESFPWEVLDEARETGILLDYAVEKWFCDAKIMDIFEGTGQIQRTIIAQDLTGLDCK